MPRGLCSRRVLCALGMVVTREGRQAFLCENKVTWGSIYKNPWHLFGGRTERERDCTELSLFATSKTKKELKHKCRETKPPWTILPVSNASPDGQILKIHWEVKLRILVFFDIQLEEMLLRCLSWTMVFTACTGHLRSLVFFLGQGENTVKCKRGGWAGKRLVCKAGCASPATVSDLWIAGSCRQMANSRQLST